MTHSDPLDSPRLAALLQEVRSEYASVPVQADPRVAALFAAHAPAPVDASIAIHPARRRPMVSDILKSLPGKVAAGFVGATLAWSGLGIAGAVSGPLSLASDDSELNCPADGTTDDGSTVEEGTVEGSSTEEGTVDDGTTDDGTTDDGTTDECTTDDGSSDDGTTDDGTTDDGTTDDGSTEDEDDGTDDEADDDGTDVAAGDLPTVPTRVSEAAHIHDFDDECGNHGTYVSHFARTGTEPECATAAREAAAGEEGDEAVEDEVTDDEAEVTEADAKAEKKAAKDNAKAEKEGAKAKGGKGKGGKGKRR